jgi:hypothetical protein
MADTHLVGTACELRFAADAILKGYDVYMPCCGTQKGHDVVIQKDGVWSRIQVKKASIQEVATSTIITASINGHRNKAIPKDQYDFLALVSLETHRTWLMPVEEVTTNFTVSKSINKLSDWDGYLF